jgi:hypothetical protein
MIGFALNLYANSMDEIKKKAFGTIHPRRHASNHKATPLPSPQRRYPHGFTLPCFGDFAPSLDDSSQISTIFGSVNFVKV